MVKNTDITPYRQDVKIIKKAILESQGRALRLASGQQLSLYFGIGQYISAHSREGHWGTGAIDAISEQLHKEMPGLRGFSSGNMRKMRIFAEFWSSYINCSPMANEIESTDTELIIATDSFSIQKWSPVANEINREDILSVSFSHHMEILLKTKDINEVLFYLRQTVIHQWNKYELRDALKQDIFKNGNNTIPNNFIETVPDTRLAIKTIRMFKDSYLGQLFGYLKILDDKVRKSHENPSVGIILCKEADKAYAEYAVRDYSKPMGVATYKTLADMPDSLREALPDIEELKKLL